MIAYDGSAQSDSIITDLYSSGLPAVADVLMISVIEDVTTTGFSRFDVVERARNAFRAPSVLGVVSHDSPDAEALRQSGAAAVKKIRRLFPEWKIQHRLITGFPIETFLAEAIVWKPDMILVGSHGRSLVGRLLLGSFSLEVATRALCSVRVSKSVSANHKHKPRILLGFDSTEGTEMILESVSGRDWHDESDVRILYVPNKQLTEFVEQLKSAGLEIDSRSVSFDLGSELVEESKSWRSDLICIADPQLDSPLISTVLGQTACPVEIIRNGHVNDVQNLTKGELFT